MATYVYTAKFQPEPEGGYTVTIPALRGLVTYGETSDEAKANAYEALELYLESLLERNKPIPSDIPLLSSGVITEKISVSLEKMKVALV